MLHGNSVHGYLVANRWGELNKVLQNIDLDKIIQNKTHAGQEAPHSGHTQEDAAMCDVEAMTEADTSSTPEVALQTTESQHPLHSPDISKAVENALHDLAVVIATWPHLPLSMQKGIVAMVQSINSHSGQSNDTY